MRFRFAAAFIWISSKIFFHLQKQVCHKSLFPKTNAWPNRNLKGSWWGIICQLSIINTHSQFLISKMLTNLFVRSSMIFNQKPNINVLDIINIYLFLCHRLHLLEHRTLFFFSWGPTVNIWCSVGWWFSRRGGWN